MGKIELNSLTLEEIKLLMVQLDQKPYRGEQLFSSFNKNGELDIEEICLLPKNLRKILMENGRVNKIKILKRFDSKLDSTKKYLYVLEDNNIIESVFMMYSHGNTMCISTQVGCRMGCEFCASTKEGRVRDLTPSEMLNQIYLAEKDLGESIDNIVLMGSGEPLDNYENTLKFLNIIHDSKGHNTSYRNITLSTCGIVPKIYDLAKEGLPITLSISLHTPFDGERTKIMPIAKKYGVEDLLKASKYYVNLTNRRITFEYTLIKGVNDRMKDINELIKLLKGINCHVNLIPLNTIKEYNKERSENVEVERFKKKLEQNHISVSIRKEKGLDISASCGQLRSDYINQF